MKSWLESFKEKTLTVKLGVRECDHPHLTVKNNDPGCLTRLYVCTRCGKEHLAITEPAAAALMDYTRR